MAPLVMQIGGRDSPDQLAEGRFRIDRIAWIDVALPRSRLRKHSEVNKLRSLAVPREIGPHLAWRHIGKRVGCRLCVVRRALATPAVVLARKRLRESGASSLLGSIGRSRSFELMNIPLFDLKTASGQNLLAI